MTEIAPAGDGERSGGARLASLLLDSQSWATRRVEVISHAANGETRRSISLDFRIPKDLAISENPETVLVPLALLRKGPLTSLDVRDDGGRAIPVLDREANAVWAEQALASTLAGDLEATLTPEQLEVVRLVVGGEPSVALAAADDLKRSLLPPEDHPGGELPLFGSFALMDDLAASFILLAEIPNSVLGRRTVVKFSYEDSPVAPPFKLW